MRPFLAGMVGAATFTVAELALVALVAAKRRADSFAFDAAATAAAADLVRKFTRDR